MPKYQDIREELLGRITSGRWAPGAAIPHEAELATEFGVTRPTISKALADLVDRGLVERKRRAGSRVAVRSARDAVLTVPIVREEIEGRGGRYGYLLAERAIAPPPPPVRALFGLGPEATALHLVALHFEDGRPYQLEDRWIHPGTVPNAADQDFSERSANEWLVREVPYSQAEHVLSAAAASEEEAAALQVAPGAPVFVIERSTWIDGAAVTRVRLVHPAERFRIVARDMR